MTTAARVRPPSPARFLATFVYAWLVIGLFTGTLVLVVAVRGILSVIERLGFDQAAQNRTFMLVILLFVVGSFLLARAVVRSVYRRPPRTRMAVLVLLAVPALLSLVAWSNPMRFLAGIAGAKSTSLSTNRGAKFIFGSYPDDQRIRELKAQGVTALVSLQSPRVVVEISGINEERNAAARAGLKMIEAPMLPWVSDNTESLELIRQLALSRTGTYYVHCGLGRDRVNIAKRVIESTEAQGHVQLAVAGDLKHALGFESRTQPFERGQLYRLAAGAWMIPLPNDAEFYGFILQGQPANIVLALDSTDVEQRAWLTKARAQMTQYAVRNSFIQYPPHMTPAEAAALATRIQHETLPFTVILPRTTFDPGPPKDPLGRALAAAYGVTTTTTPSIGPAPVSAGVTPPRPPAGPRRSAAAAART